MKANTTNELSHAGQCLDIYLNTECEIYDRFTVPAIGRVVAAYKAGESVCTDPEHFIKDVQEVTPAIQAAAWMVCRYDGMQPTADDIKAVTAAYVELIVDEARIELKNN